MPGAITVDLKRLIANNEACLVLGAGVSKASCPHEPSVTWLGLIERGMEYLNDADPEHKDTHAAVFKSLTLDGSNTSNYLLLGEYLETQLDKFGGGFAQWLQSQFENLKPEDKRLIKALEELQLPIITTNYDGLFEQATLRSRCTPKNVAEFVSEIRNPAGVARRTVFHIHGYYNEPETVVFGSSSYQRLLNVDFLQSLERSVSVFKALIFVGTGSGIADPHFDDLLSWVSSNPNIGHRVFFLTTNAAAQKLPKSVVPVRYGPDHSHLLSYLAELAPRKIVNEGPSASVRAFLNHLELDSTRVDLDTGGHAAVAQALSPIALDEIEERARFLLLLERSKAYCKINRFQDALTDAALVSKYFRNKNLTYFMKAEAVTNTVLRDQERWDDAATQGQRMVAIAEGEGGRRTRVVAYHALARSLALAGHPDQAIEYAAKTLGQAVTADERGEAFFAEGEARRHRGDTDLAISAYIRSEKTTFISGKTDLYIWCKLCLADCFFMLGNMHEADKQLHHFSSAIRTTYDDHPLETLHWKLSDAANKWQETRSSSDAIAMVDVARQYGDILSISWPADYCVALQAGNIIPKKL